MLLDDDSSDHDSNHDSTNADKKDHDTSSTGQQCKVGVVGAGAIALSSAFFLEQSGHEVQLWNPPYETSKKRDDGAVVASTTTTSEEWTIAGAPLTDESQKLLFRPTYASSSLREFIDTCPVLLIGIPANGQAPFLDDLASCLAQAAAASSEQPCEWTLLFSSHLSFATLYLENRLEQEWKKRTVQTTQMTIHQVAWSTTVCTARKDDSTRTLLIPSIRTLVDVCTTTVTLGSRDDLDVIKPDDTSYRMQGLCQRLFPQVDTFRLQPNLLALTLSNVNAQNHLAIVLGNVSRMECCNNGQPWDQMKHVTPSLARLLEQLDAERLDIADALDLRPPFIKTVHDHFGHSFGIEKYRSMSLYEILQTIHQDGRDVSGPTDMHSTRYIWEDVPYGLVPIVRLGDLVGRPAVLHHSGIQLVSAMVGMDFMKENDLMPAAFALGELQEEQQEL